MPLSPLRRCTLLRFWTGNFLRPHSAILRGELLETFSFWSISTQRRQTHTHPRLNAPPVSRRVVFMGHINRYEKRGLICRLIMSRGWRDAWMLTSETPHSPPLRRRRCECASVERFYKTIKSARDRPSRQGRRRVEMHAKRHGVRIERARCAAADSDVVNLEKSKKCRRTRWLDADGARRRQQ